MSLGQRLQTKPQIILCFLPTISDIPNWIHSYLLPLQPDPHLTYLQMREQTIVVDVVCWPYNFGGCWLWLFYCDISNCWPCNRDELKVRMVVMSGRGPPHYNLFLFLLFLIRTMFKAILKVTSMSSPCSTIVVLCCCGTLGVVVMLSS